MTSFKLLVEGWREFLNEDFDYEENGLEDPNKVNSDVFNFIISVLNKDIDFGKSVSYSFSSRDENEIPYTEIEKGAGVMMKGSLSINQEMVSKIKDHLEKKEENLAKNVVLDLVKNKIRKSAKLK